MSESAQRESEQLANEGISVNEGWKVVCSDRILTCRIKSICPPAKGGTGCYRFNYQPGS